MLISTPAKTEPRRFKRGDKYPVLMRHNDDSLYLFFNDDTALCITDEKNPRFNGVVRDSLRVYNTEWSVAVDATVTLTQD